MKCTDLCHCKDCANKRQMVPDGDEKRNDSDSDDSDDSSTEGEFPFPLKVIVDMLVPVVNLLIGFALCPGLSLS